MGLEARQAVKARSKATGPARTVEMALADYAADGEQWIVWVTNSTLEREWGLLERTAQRGLRALEQLGEIRRRADLEESTGRNRVYELVPGGSLQLTLPLENLSVPKGVTPSDARQTPRHLARARHERTEVTGEHPPSPQRGGGPSPFDGVPPRRSRSPRRRQRAALEADYSFLAEPCPIADGQQPTGEVLAAQAAWERVEAGVRRAIGEEAYTVWFESGGIHAHETRDGLLVIAVRPVSAQWINGRWPSLFARRDEPGVKLSLVGCQRLLSQPKAAVA